MAEGFVASHVPQQSRRDKLRILSHQHQQPNLLPYDPYLLQVPPDLLTCPSSATSSLVKEETSSTLLRFASNRSCTLPDPLSSSSENPSHFHDANPSFLCTQPDLERAREWGDSSFGGRNGQGLSLSLSSRVHCHGNDDVQKNHPFELNLERYGSLALYGSDKGSGSGSGPLGPFTGYSLILRGSKFLKPAQKLLEELTDVGRGMFFAERVAEADSSLMEGGGGGGESIGNPDDPHRVGSGDGGELGGKKSRLISLLEEVCRRYMQYYQQLQDVVASFECVAELGNAAPYVNLALKAMSKHFRCLKDAIMDQLHFTSKGHEKPADTRDDIAGFGTIERSRLGQRASKNSGYLQQQPVWRPQRGLPERAVTVLRAWLFEHFLHPYPTDTDKLMLAKQTGLSRCQVSNWFINARVRLWKPMVEEIHTLETQQMQVSQITRRDERSVMQTSNDDHPQMPSSVPSPSTARVGALTSALSTVRNEAVHYLSHVAVGESIGSGTSSGVTLTLGLHHPRLGIAVETTGDGNVMGGYGTQDWQFGRDVCDGTWPASQ